MVLALLVLVSFAQDTSLIIPDNQNKTDSGANPANASDPKANATNLADSSSAPTISGPKVKASNAGDSNSASNISELKDNATKTAAIVDTTKSSKAANAPKNTKSASPNNFIKQE